MGKAGAEVIRLNQTEIIVGRKGVGKSTYANRRAIKYPQHKKVLIVDVNKSPAYAAHPFIDSATLLSGRWKSGIVRYYERDKNLMFDTIMQHCENSGLRPGILIIFEDCTKYIPANPQPAVKSFLVDHRMWNADLVFTFHSVKRIPPFFWEMCTHLTLFKTQENFETARNENVIPNFHEIARARKLVMDSSNEREKRTVETKT